MERRKKITYTIMAIFAVLSFIFTSLVGGGVGVAHAATSTDVQSVFESRNILDDLEGSTIGGKEFSLDNFGWNEKAETQVISFLEFCYSYGSEDMDDYGLYIYVYNPKCVEYDYDSELNKISFAVTDDSEDETVGYWKRSLKYLNMSTKAGYEGLFFKYKVVLQDGDKAAIRSAVNISSRVYKISEIELRISGETNAKAYSVGQIYTYSGYAEGYGNSYATEDTLSCTVDGFNLYLSLDVHSTYYRPEGTNGTGYTRDTLHSVYFSVPNGIIEEYGEMTAVHATWLNALTSPIFVTGNSDVYNAVSEYLGQYVYGGSYQSVSDDNSNNNLVYSLIASKHIESASWNNASYGSSYMSYNENRKYTVSDNYIEYLQYCFLADGGDADNYILPAETLLGNKADGTKGYFETYTEEHGGNLVNGKYSSALFDSVDGEVTDISISATDTFTLTDEVISQSLWQKFVGGGYNVSGTNTYTVSAIKKVESNDFKSTAAETCAGLYIDESDYTDFRKYYNTATSNNETVYLFRYYQSDYTHYEVAEYTRSKGDYTILQGYTFDYEYIDTNAYFMQMWVQLDFDIIDLTFTKNGVETVIPVVMSPMDMAADGGETLFPTSDDGLDWWHIILAVLALILILVLCAPFLPIIVQAVLWVILLPFKALGSLFKGIKNSVSKNKRGK